MKNNLFDAIRLQCERKGLNNELKQLKSAADELNRRAQINPMGQVQIPMTELRSVINESGATLINGYEVTPTANIITRSRFLEGLQANVLYPIFKTNPSYWANEQQGNQDITHVMLSPHRMFSELTYDLALILSTDSSIQKALTEDLVNNIYAKVESTLLSDSDTTNGNPLGLFSMLTPTETTALTINVFASAEKNFYSSGAKTPLYIFSPSAFAKVKATFKELFINGKFNDIDYIVTNNMQSDYILLCDLSHLLVSLFGALDVVVDDVTQKREGKVRLICNSYWDWNVTNDGAFQAIKLSN